MNAHAEWQFEKGQRPALVLCRTGDDRIDGIPLAFGGDKAGTARACLAHINSQRAKLGLPAITITNTVLSGSPPSRVPRGGTGH